MSLWAAPFSRSFSVQNRGFKNKLLQKIILSRPGKGLLASQDRKKRTSAGHPINGHISHLPFKFMLRSTEEQGPGLQCRWGSKVIIWRVTGTSSTQDPGTTWRRSWRYCYVQRLSSSVFYQWNSVSSCSHPSPVRAQQAWMCHWWSLTEVSCRLCEISATDMQPFTSCLFAKTNSPAFLKSCKGSNRIYNALITYIS